MRTKVKLGVLALAFMIVSCESTEVEEPLKSVAVKTTEKQSVEVFNPISGTVNGTATLHRNKNGLTLNYKTKGLIPGHTYTIWWVIWNQPQNCAVPGECNDGDFAIADQVEVDVLYGTGHLVGANGKGHFSASINAGDDSGSINDLFEIPPAGGLQVGNTMAAEVHAVLRSHGPAIPGLIDDQISSYEGGCTDPFAFPPFSEIPDAVGECGDIEFAIFPPLE